MIVLVATLLFLLGIIAGLVARIERHTRPGKDRR